jgi:UDP-glucose 4-epimerase
MPGKIIEAGFRMRLLIIGCTGFFATTVCRIAARHGYEVIGVGRSERPADWQGNYLQRPLDADFAQLILDHAPQAILHLVGPSSVASSFVTPLEDLQAGFFTWANTLDGVRRSARHPVVFFPSSAAVYGNPSHLPMREDDAVAPVSPYGFHKAACELLGREYADCFGLDVIVGRFFSTFGTAQQRLLIWELYEQLTGQGHTIELEGTGRESRDYLEVTDAMAAVLAVVQSRLNSRDHDSSAHTPVLCVNIASGIEVNVLEIAQQLRALIAPGKSIRCRGVERKGDPLAWRADIERLRSLIPDWRPRALHQALSECISAWQKSQSRDG